MPFTKSISTLPALLAAASLTAVPAQAADIAVPASPSAIVVAPAWAPGDDDAEGYRRYRHRRHRGVDAGDVIAGILILGGIAAVASAAKKSDDRYPPRDARYREPYRQDARYDGARGLDRAASMCVESIERDVRVDTVDSVNRDAQGWTVVGRLYDGQAFTCSIGADGRIDAIDYGAGSARYETGGEDDYGYVAQADGQQADRQHGDDVYAAARARSDAPKPAYPGGPLPGEEAAIDGDLEYGTGYRSAGG